METPKTLAIIIPIYQPPDNWENILNSRLKLFQETLPSYFTPKIYIIDDGSSPKVKPQLVDIEFLSYSPNMGKGYAIRYALEKIQSDLYMYTDVDIPYNNQCMNQIIAEIDNGADIAIAIRQNDYITQISFIRRIISNLLKWLIRNLLGLKNQDTQGGLKAMNDKGKQILLKTKINRYLFDLEWIKLAEMKNLKISSIPVRLNETLIQKPLPYGVLLKEFWNFIRLIFSR